MTGAGQRRLRRRLFHLFNQEYGALLWVPSVLAAAAVLLWALQIVPSESARYTESADFLVVLGPVAGLAEEPATVVEFRRALRAHLELQREFHLIDDAALQKRLHAVHGGSLPTDPLDWIRASRNFKARFYLTGEISRLADGDLVTQFVVWEAATEQALDTVEGRAATPNGAATQVANALGVTLFSPQLQRSALR